MGSRLNDGRGSNDKLFTAQFRNCRFFCCCRRDVDGADYMLQESGRAQWLRYLFDCAGIVCVESVWMIEIAIEQKLLVKMICEINLNVCSA